MCRSNLLRYLVLLNQMIFSVVAVTAKQYASMPTLFQFDDYDQCMLYGKEATYCTITFQLYPKNSANPSQIWNVIKEVNLKPTNYRHDLLRHGVCLPKTCPNIVNKTGISQDNEEIIRGLTYCYNQKLKSSGLRGNVVKIYCEGQNTPYPVDSYDILFALVVILYLLLVTFASIYEGAARYKSKKSYERITGTCLGKFLSSFSIPKNFYRLKKIDHKNPLRCIQGIRFFNMICVIMAHTLMAHFALPVSNTMYTEKITTVFFNSLLTNGGYAVQTFFLISGWLLTYNIFATFERGKELKLQHLLAIFATRYLRLTPTMLIVLAFHSTWLVHLTRGPFWDQTVGEEYRRCRRNWWTNMLYVNNFINKEKMCLQQTWYLACDTQLFALFLLIIFFMKKYEKHSKLIIGTVLTTGILVPFIISYLNNYDILVRHFPESMYDFLLFTSLWHTMYAASYSNIVGYGLGIMFGYIYYKTKGMKLVTTKIYVTLWWILSFGLSLGITLSAGIIYQENFEFSRIDSALYWALGKCIFALGLGIGIFGMTQNIGWVVLWICRWSPAQILGRVSFSAYLVHVGMIKLKMSFHRQPIYAANYLLFQSVLSDVTMAFLIATVITLTVEMPLSALQKLV